MYALVQNGNVVRLGIAPDFCPNGCTVSNPELLPPATLLSLGYYPYTEDIPTYNPETHYATFDHHEILADGVVGHYTTQALQPTAADRLTALENVVTDILFSSLPF